MRRAAWRRFASHFRGEGGRLLLCTLVGAVQSLLVVPVAALVRYSVDVVIPAGDVALLAGVGGAILAVSIADAGLAVAVRRLSLRVTKLAVLRLRSEVLAKLYSLPRAFHSEAQRSRLHTVTVEDSERVDIMSNAVLSQILPAAVTGAAVAVFLAVLNVRLFLVLAALAPLALAVSRLVRGVIRQRVRNFQRAFESFSDGIWFVLSTLDLTRAHGGAESERQRQHERFERLRGASSSMAWLQSSHGLLQGTLLTLAGVVVLIVGGRSVAAGTMTMGDLLSFLVAAGLLTGRLRTALAAAPHVVIGEEALANLHELLSEPAEPAYVGRRRIAFSGRVRFEDVGFGYRGEPLLRDLTLDLEPGRIVAIVGRNGAGKSTLAYLALGFYRPTCGRVLADGTPYEELDLDALRRSFGFVGQEPEIFGGTVWDNLTHGLPGTSEREAEEAAARAGAMEFVRRLPAGFGTTVGDEGERLSGGQRQRLALARAFLRRPSLLVLDEPTSHLDAEGAQHVLEALRALPWRPACLLVTHDAGTAARADDRFELKDGILAAIEAAPPAAARPV